MIDGVRQLRNYDRLRSVGHSAAFAGMIATARPGSFLSFAFTGISRYRSRSTVHKFHRGSNIRALNYEARDPRRTDEGVAAISRYFVTRNRETIFLRDA